VEIMAEQKYRIGLGYDIHRLADGRDLIIGGVKITHERGLLGHSDADVLVHAIIDALLGAVALDDIGTLFPDTDPKYKDADSILLLKNVYEKVQQEGYWINNIDSNIIAQEPKMMPYIPKMKEILSDVLDLEPMDISIKAKTKEKLDSVGEKKAIEANTIVMLEKINN
jgi:2-C-methyl-D-erythritol 2,4-cyclodiphosphate synthase